MKTTMIPNFVTTHTFNKAMKKIDQSFETVDARFDSVDQRFKEVDTKLDEMRVMIRETMEEQRVFFTNEMSQHVGALMEEFSGRFKSLYEHPVFANHKS